MTSSVTSERDGAVVVIQLSRPAKRNAIDLGMLDELDLAITRATAVPTVRCIVISGSGGHFSAGADITGYDSDAAAFSAFSDRANSVCARIANLRLPVIASVDGFALGGGFELALACDLIVASDCAVFGLPEVALGLIPGWGGTQRLTRHLGASRAKEMMWMGTRFTAEDARSAGIVNLVVDPAELEAQSVALARRIAALPRHAVESVKVATSNAASEPRPGTPGFAVERAELIDLFDDPDAREGIQSFIQKRPPSFAK